ncbi:MAG TPA: CAP domain-containing protein [Chthoniobacteraceae bacterium]
MPHSLLSTIARWLLIATLGLVSPTALFAALNSQEQAVANLLVSASGQQRNGIQLDPILAKVARERAADMARRDYFGHVNPDGCAANYLVVQAGYQLPSNYPTSRSSNNIESIAAGRDSASAVWNDWMGSSSHKSHLLGTEGFYTEQTSYGVGYFYDAGSTYKHYWVVLTAPPSAGADLNITAPIAGASINGSQVALAGRVSGNSATAVQFRVENSAGNSSFRPATGVASWSAVATDLIPGSNTLRIRVLNATGNVLAEATRPVRYTVLSPLTVSVEGNGSVTSGFAGTTTRELGRSYTVVAQPAAGQLFAGWSGSVTSSRAALTFTMREGFVINARFVPNPFDGRDGAYNGLVQTTDGAAVGSGLVRMKLNTKGAFSGRLLLGGASYSLKGRFNGDGSATLTIPQAGKAPLTVTLQLDLAAGTGAVSGSITDGTFTASLNAGYAPAGTAATPSPMAGRYTVAIPANPETSSSSRPQGTGYATLQIAKDGTAKLVGSLADGQGFTQSIAVTTDGRLPLYVALYSGSGSLSGELLFQETEDSHCAGLVRWNKPAQPGSTLYPEAFSTVNGMYGSRYISQPGSAVLEVAPVEANAQLQIAGELGAEVIQSATLEENNRVTVEKPVLPGIGVKINAADGRFSGSFVHPTGGQSRFRGVIFQKKNAGFGYYLGATESGQTSFTAVQ